MLWKAIGIVLLVSLAKTLAINDTQDLVSALDTQDLVSALAVKRAAIKDETRPRRETSTESSDCTLGSFFIGCFMKLGKLLTGYLGGLYEVPYYGMGLGGSGGYGGAGGAGGAGGYGGAGAGGYGGTPGFKKNTTTKAWDGSYSWKFYVPENEISAEESGIVDQNVPEGPGTVVRGSFSFSAPDGSHFRVTYTADERGFLPSGDHLPTSPPIPEAILKALIQNAADEKAGIFDDGSYKEGRG